ncbi:MAG: hypothetical protein PHQ13_02220 [Rhodoferax sp.]|nr:hypothetical protein [Rhodoferax sp.]
MSSAVGSRGEAFPAQDKSLVLAGFLKIEPEMLHFHLRGDFDLRQGARYRS